MPVNPPTAEDDIDNTTFAENPNPTTNDLTISGWDANGNPRTFVLVLDNPHMGGLDGWIVATFPRSQYAINVAAGRGIFQNS